MTMSRYVEANLINFLIQHTMHALCNEINTAFGHNLKLAAALSRVPLQSTRRCVAGYCANMFAELERPTLVHRAGSLNNHTYIHTHEYIYVCMVYIHNVLGIYIYA